MSENIEKESYVITIFRKGENDTMIFIALSVEEAEGVTKVFDKLNSLSCFKDVLRLRCEPEI